MIGLLCVVPAQAAAQQQVVQVPGLRAPADSLAAGPDGALWATLSADPGRVARIAPDGTITYPLTGGLGGFPQNVRPAGLRATSDSLWMLLASGGPGSTFGRATTDGQFTSFALSDGRPTSLATAQDGSVWMTVDGRQATDAITRYQPNPPPATETTYTGGLTQTSDPNQITTATDGSHWFVDTGAKRLGHVSPAGEISYQQLDETPQATAAGPHNELWYAQGSIIKSSDGATLTSPRRVWALATGPDGALWAAITGGAVRIDPTTNTTTFVPATSDPAADTVAIAAGPDKHMWLALDRAPYLVRIATPPRADALTATPEGLLRATIDPNGEATTVVAETLDPDGTWRGLATNSLDASPQEHTFDLRTILGPGQHVVRLTLTSAGGTQHSAAITLTIPTPAPTPAAAPTGPQEGETVEVKVVSGTVAFRLPQDNEYTEIKGSVILPLGVVLDTEQGKVDVASAYRGKTQKAAFNAGKFAVTQTRTGITELALAGPLQCNNARNKAQAAAKPKNKKKKRTLWAKDDNGSYRTRGTSSVATVRGTEWRTEDTCDGTTIYVRSGTVSVWPRQGGRSKLVKAGHRLFTPRPK